MVDAKEARKLTKKGREQQVADEMDRISALIERAAENGFDNVQVHRNNQSNEDLYSLIGKYKSELADMGYVLAFGADGVKIKW